MSRRPQPRARHLSVPTTVLRRVVRLDKLRLAFFRLREGVASLFAHALDLSDFADGLLELLHSVEKELY